MLKPFLLLPLALVAAAGTFPLETGNSWTYREAGQWFQGSETRTIAVQAKENVGDREYFRTEYFGRTLLLRAAPDGTIYSYNVEKSVEEPWLSFGAAEGTSFPAHPDPCTNTGTIVSRKAERSTPAGTFTGVVQISFRGLCADAGTTQQFWAENVGLVTHEETTFAGPRRFDLVAYRPAAAAAAPEVSFTIGLDAQSYTVGNPLTSG